MGAVHSFSEPLSRQAILIGSLSPTFTSRLRFSPRLSAALPKRFCTIPNCSEEIPRPLGDRSVRVRVRVSSRVQVQDTTQLKENWLDSLSCPFPPAGEPPAAAEDEPVLDTGSGWVVGIDPDSSGALALIKPDSSAQVFDTPYLQVLVGKKVRKRLDARSIVQLLHSFGAPLGTTAYIEQSNPFPKDGKQGWWSGGFTYGLWLGVLVATGFSVVPVSPRLWKDRFELCGSSSTKDDSRTTASVLFPSLSTSLKRKKDHGRAEALLIAAYGKGLSIQPSSCAVQSF